MHPIHYTYDDADVLHDDPRLYAGIVHVTPAIPISELPGFGTLDHSDQYLDRVYVTIRRINRVQSLATAWPMLLDESVPEPTPIRLGHETTTLVSPDTFLLEVARLIFDPINARNARLARLIERSADLLVQP